MIWRLPHPVLGMVLFVVVWVGGASVIGFGLGVPEVGVLTALASGAFLLANRRRSRDL